MKTLLRIEKGEIYKILVADAISSATVWTLYDDREPTLKATLAASEELLLGPYINITTFEVDGLGDVVITKEGNDFSTPVELFEYQTPVIPGAAVDDAVDETDIVAQFNALLASLRAVDLIETEE